MKRSLTPQVHSYRYVNLWLSILCISIFLTLTVFVIQHAKINLESELNQETQNIQKSLAFQLDSGLHILDGFTAFFQTIDQVDYKSLEDYSNSIREQYPHIDMIQYMERINHSDVSDFIYQQKRMGHPNYNITQLDPALNFAQASKRKQYYPLVFISPLMIRSAPFLGYDMYSSEIIRRAIDSARSSNTHQSTAPLNIFSDHPGYLIIKRIDNNESIENDQTTNSNRFAALLINLDELASNTRPSNDYQLTFTHYNSNTDTSTTLSTINKLAEAGELLPVFSDTKSFSNAGQIFNVTLNKQMHWSDINFEWIIFSFISTAAFALLVFNYAHLRIKTAQDHERTQLELFREKELAEVTLHSIGEAVITTDTNESIQYMNPIACLLTGWSNEDARGRPLSEIFKLIHEESREPVESTVTESLRLHCTVRSDEPTLLVNKKGDEFSIENSAALIREGNGDSVGVVLVFRNISHIRNLSRKMEFQATHDALTELINRREFENQLKLAAKSARDHNHNHALCYMDLDQFKIVNDTCGHIAGDQLLRELAKIMPKCIRSSDCLARLGGDEFGVLMFDCPTEKAKEVAEELRKTIKEFAFSWDKKTFDIGVSIGLVPINKDSGSIQDIMRRADSACYIAKDFGRNRIHIYTPDDYELTKRHGEMQWLTRIQKALEENNFQLALQSVQAINNQDEKTHHEILLRMENEDGSPVPPMSFIPAAERYDMMAELDMWVIKNTFKLIRQQADFESKQNVFNINLSGQSLTSSDITQYVRDQVKHYNIPPEILCFEITETAIIANLALAIEFITEMKDIGCKFALDDFGSGLSSFAYLKKLPVDYLKIDGAFIQDIVNDPMDKAIVSAINDIGHEMGLLTIAEYVENDEILHLLKELGVDYAQGYAIEKPYPWVSPFLQSHPNLTGMSV